MATVDSIGIEEEVDRVSALCSRALGSRTAEDFETLEHHLGRFEAHVREAFQMFHAKDARTAVQHLESGQPLTDTDRDVIRAFLISDAEAYLKHENDFQRWLSELERLTARLGEFAHADTPEAVSDLRGVVLDAMRLVPDLRNYLDQQRRITRFERALLELDATSRRLLAELIHEQINSSTR